MGNEGAYARAGRSGLADAGTSLLSQPTEALQQAVIGDAQVVLSVLDDLPIGAGTDLGSDLTGHAQVLVYAEQVTLFGAVTAQGATISANQLVDGGASSGPATLDVSGAAGDTPAGVNTDPSTATQPGGDGGAGGTAALYVETVDPAASPIGVIARGGAGGAGQEGSDGVPGGDGGSGGAGGTATLVAIHPALALFDRLRAIYAGEDAAAMVVQLADLVAEDDDPRLAPIVAVLPAEGAPTPPLDDLKSAVEQAGNALAAAAAAWGQSAARAVAVDGGAYGVYGTGEPNGRDGQAGAPGSAQVLPIGASTDMASSALAAPFLWVHPAQCAMALEKAKLMYLTADAATDPTSVQDLVVLLRRVQDRCAPFAGLDAASPVAELYAAKETSVGAIGSVASLAGTHGEATRYLGQVQAALDVFGYAPDHVPLASYAFYDTVLDQLVGNFSVIADAYQTTYAQLGQAEQSLDAIKSARDQATGLVAQDQANLKDLQNDAQATAHTIASYTPLIAQKLETLDIALSDLQSEIENWFDFSFKDLLSSLAMVAMVPESSAMWAAAGAQFLYGASTEVTGDDGQKIEKSYLVGQIQTAKADVGSLIETYQTLDDGEMQPTDPGAAKILVEESGLLKLLGDVSGTFPDAYAAVRDAFDDYVGTILARNGQILTYNATIQLLARTAQEIATLEAQVSALDDQALAEMGAEPDWPSLTAFVSRLYYGARTQVLETLDLTGRAFNFWALQEVDQLPLALGSPSFSDMSLPAIDVAALTAARSRLIGQYAAAVEGFGVNASSFPAQGGQDGIMVPLSALQIGDLKRYGETMVMVPAAVPGSARSANPFAGMANVRLTNVRCWLDGAQTKDGEIQVTIKHTGKETIVRPDGGQLSFGHSPKLVPFRYNLGTSEIFEDGTAIGVAFDGTASPYALVGPFTWWHVSVDATENSGLDLSGLTGGRLEFHGTNYAFE